MGKRKGSSKKPTGPKKREPLATTFTCLFCNHEKAVGVKMDKKSGTGQLSCKICGQHFQSTINYLSAPVDVYTDWLDACESVAKEAVAEEATAEDNNFSTYASERPHPAVPATGDEDEDGGYDDDY